MHGGPRQQGRAQGEGQECGRFCALDSWRQGGPLQRALPSTVCANLISTRSQLLQEYAFPPDNEDGGGAYSGAGGKGEGSTAGEGSSSKPTGGSEGDSGRGGEGQSSKEGGAGEQEQDGGSKEGAGDAQQEGGGEQGKGDKKGSEAPGQSGSTPGQEDGKGGSQEGGHRGGTIAMCCGPPIMVRPLGCSCTGQPRTPNGWMSIAFGLEAEALPCFATLPPPHPFYSSGGCRLRRRACRRCGSWGLMRTTSSCSERAVGRRLSCTASKQNRRATGSQKEGSAGGTLMLELVWCTAFACNNLQTGVMIPLSCLQLRRGAAACKRRVPPPVLPPPLRPAFLCTAPIHNLRTRNYASKSRAEWKWIAMPWWKDGGRRRARHEQARACLLHFHSQTDHHASRPSPPARDAVLLPRLRRSCLEQGPHGCLQVVLQHQVGQLAAREVACWCHRPTLPSPPPLRSLSGFAPRPASTLSTFDGLDQPNWRQRLERDVLPAVRQGYNIDVPPARVPVSSLAACGCTKWQRSNARSVRVSAFIHARRVRRYLGASCCSRAAACNEFPRAAPRVPQPSQPASPLLQRDSALLVPAGAGGG